MKDDRILYPQKHDNCLKLVDWERIRNEIQHIREKVEAMEEDIVEIQKRHEILHDIDKTLVRLTTQIEGMREDDEAFKVSLKAATDDITFFKTDGSRKLENIKEKLAYGVMGAVVAGLVNAILQLIL